MEAAQMRQRRRCPPTMSTTQGVSRYPNASAGISSAMAGRGSRGIIGSLITRKQGQRTGEVLRPIVS